MQEYGKINSALRKNKKQVTIQELAKLNGKGEFRTRQELLNYIYQEIDALPANVSLNKCKHLYKAFKCFDDLYSLKDKEQVLMGLKKIQKLCNQKINKNKKILQQENIYEKILDIVKVTLLNMSCDNNEQNKKAELLKYIIFEMRNINYVYELLKTYPNYIFEKDENGYVLETVVEEYIKLAKNETYSYDLIYLERIIKIFVEHKKFVENNDIKIKLLNKIRNQIKKNKPTFFLNEIINDINQINVNTKTFDDLAFKYGITTNFSNDILIEAKKEIVYNHDELYDLRHINTITIDGPSTWVYDDAISLTKLSDNKLLLGVYVADVASYVPKGSLIDKLAYERSETLYLPKTPITMLPQDLTNSLTLKEKKDKTAIGHFFVFDENLEIESFKVHRCLINVDKNYTYNDVINSLNFSKNTEELELLTTLAEISINLHDESGTRLEYRALKKLKKEIDGKETVDPSISTLMIMEFMTLTNNYIAKFFAKKATVPFIYRVNTTYGDDIQTKLMSLTQNDNEQNVKKLLKRMGTVSFYSPFNLGHKGLSLDSYCHSTNPLRNYASLECQRIIVDTMINNIDISNFEERFDEILELCEYMNRRIESNKSFAEECYTLKKVDKNK